MYLVSATLVLSHTNYFCVFLRMRHNPLLSFNHSGRVRQGIRRILYSGSLVPVHGPQKNAEFEHMKDELRCSIGRTEDVQMGKY